MASNGESIKQTAVYLTILIPAFLVLQALLIVMHEFTHSTTAWLLGHMDSPLNIVWGNPVMMTGWDEGVGYRELFKQGHRFVAAAAGVSPLVMHTVVVCVGMTAMAKKWVMNHKLVFYALFWFVTANFMELVAYIWMRGFAPNGDTGNFNRGMEISPWFLFIFGSLALAAGLYIFYRTMLPRIFALSAPDNPVLQWAILLMSAFIIFFWGSGIRVMFYIYPNPQWMFGLISFPAFLITVYLFKPGGKPLTA